MRSLTIRLAFRVNRVLQRRGSLLADRWTRFVILEGGHGRELGTPREVRNALVYVLANGAKQGASGVGAIDPFSSAPYFSGFTEGRGRPDYAEATSVAPTTWLLGASWQKLGLISIRERTKS